MSGVGVGAQSPEFSYRLGMDRPAAPGLPSRPDGQLASMIWGAGDTFNHGYNYTYDRTGQMTAATLTENPTGVPGAWTTSATRAERGLTYDLNGNIQTLERTDEQGSVSQSLDYNYNGNLLSSVEVDGSPSEPFEYDAEGNMTFDGMSEIGIEYNILNLPAKIFAGSDTISYVYTASGERLAARLTTPGISSLTIYRSVMVYGADGGSSVG